MPHADMPQTDLDALIGHYPAWARQLARKYFTKTLNQFILHGNVRDLVPTRDDDGRPDYLPLRRFLADDLFAGRDVVLFYDHSDGIHFVDQASKADFNRALSGYDTIFGTDYAKKLPKDPVRVFALLDNYVRLRLGDGKRVAVVVDYAETVVPMAEASQYSAEDRGALVYLQKWSHDAFLLESDFSLVLITENLTDLNRQFIQSPYNAELEVEMPGTDARAAYIDAFRFDGDFPSVLVTGNLPDLIRLFIQSPYNAELEVEMPGTDARAAYIGWFLDRADRRPVFEAHSDVAPRVLAQNTAGLGYVQ